MTCFSPELEARRLRIEDVPAGDASWRLLFRGAEAVVYEGRFLDRPCVLKQRIPKRYRHPDLDGRLLRQRTVQEVRCLARLGSLTSDALRVPLLYLVRPDNYSLYLELIDGISLQSALHEEPRQAESLMDKVGKAVAAMHNAHIVHGDLTTSNMMLEKATARIVLIDFGLGQSSKSAEDKAVDLYVLERSFSSVHAEVDGLFHRFLHSYRLANSDSPAIMAKLAEVQMRGRKRSMVG
jgi:TP53 regulating kinase-like protein